MNSKQKPEPNTIEITWMDVQKKEEMTSAAELMAMSYPRVSPASLRKWLRRRQNFAIRMNRGDRIVACVLYQRMTIHDPMLVVRFAVHPVFRRLGLGTKLMDYLKSKVHGSRSVIVMDVEDSRLESHLFLRRVGLHCIKVIPNCTWPTESDDEYRFIYPHPIEKERQDEIEKARLDRRRSRGAI